MQKFIFISLFVLAFMLSCKDKKNYSFENSLIPKPLELEFKNGELEVQENIYIVRNDVRIESSRVLNFAKNYFAGVYNVKIVPEIQKDGTNIVFEISGEGDNESYNLDIDKDGIKLSSPDYNGLFLGFQTLRQLFPPELEAKEKPETVKLPYVSIKDSPRFKYRGMHMDVCRHFFSVEDVKTYIDMLVMHKFNILHWHLTDDQGWRIEIKALPKLSSIASTRRGTVIKQNWGEYDEIPVSGIFTQEQIREIVEYAEDRFITIIPEIEMPGHALAALAAYPELGCTGGPYEVCRTWGVFDDVFCAGNEETFKFFEKVIDEVVELFPNSPYIHVGGDECPKVRWEECPKCQQRIIDENLADEHELQSYFVTRMEKYINSKGKRIIGWDEILEGGLAPHATVMSWRGTEGAVAAAKLGHDAILCPTNYCYFDYYQSEDKENEPLAICCYISTEKVYSWEPIPDSIPEYQRKHFLGVQANLWAEYIKDFSHLQYMAFPRMTALSEVAWCTERDPDYAQFKKRLQVMFKRYDKAGYNYAKHEQE
ncbi:MAG: beta-N-acetylhexosaminidase [Bacteroidales bacterium]|jgi:hexosaminidase|nr:beta-N-acetylhexosaminidase [Bacteroidales bacterium]MCK9498926.1 beta-N-acetylhexosaminidase [Bacteroidales bacterium]MDY0314858.1 beta-N-acetylhexosaminidase [Bacteroidales bacterium]NLB86430.1 beta-N-acetylhexosaminidase [Bacteroidales bacterium]